MSRTVHIALIGDFDSRFQPERAAFRNVAHPLVAAFVNASACLVA